MKYCICLIAAFQWFIPVGNSKPDCPPLIISSPSRDTTTLQGAAPFKVGVAVSVFLLKTNDLYRTTVLQQYNSLTAENTMKWQAIHPAENTFDFSGGDYIAGFCANNHKRLHGHNLVWYQYNPQWLTRFSGDSAAWETVFKTHIQTVVTHYKGKAAGWDVVNEAFHDDGSLRVNDIDKADNMDDGCVWARHLGRDYIARAFVYAHQVDSAALLFYNDYSQEVNDRKTDSIVAMVNDLKDRHIPIQGLGVQMHTDVNDPKEGITKAFQKLAATGLLIHISEIDVSVNSSRFPAADFSDKLAQQQAERYAFIVQQYKLLVPESQQYGITVWNVGDKDSWIRSSLKRNDWPLPFDDNYAKKPAFYSFKQALMQ